jgi:hypothetical protein
MSVVKYYTEELTSNCEIIEILQKIGISFKERPFVEIIPVKSFDKTSFVDGVCEVYNNGVIEHKFVIEITQTTDKQSRNTSAYQRPPKFIFAKKYLPEYQQVMYFRVPFIASTNTAVIGLSILNLMGVKIINAEFESLSLESLIKLKNKISKEKSHNTPYYVEVKEDGVVEISGKLKNGNSWSDPGIGFISVMIYLFAINSGVNKFKILNHQIGGDKLFKTKNKFRKLVSLIGCEVSFENSDVVWNSNDYVFNRSEQYFTILEDGEKLSMINFHSYLQNKGHHILFTNIAGCERSKLRINGKEYTLPKTMKIPDLITLKENSLFMIEGECDYNLKKGMLQIDGFDECKNFVLSRMDNCINEVYIRVVTDKEVDFDDQKYSGYYLNEEKYLLKDEFIY